MGLTLARCPSASRSERIVGAESPARVEDWRGVDGQRGDAVSYGSRLLRTGTPKGATLPTHAIHPPPKFTVAHSDDARLLNGSSL